MIKIFPLWLFLVFVGFSFSLAQQADALEPWLDLIKEDPAIAEALADLLENPVAVNRAERHDWQRIPLLTSEDIDSILARQSRQGAFRTVRQIAKIIGKEKFKRIRPFLILRAPKSKSLQVVQRNYWNVQTPHDGEIDKFLGNEIYSLTRVQYQVKSGKRHWKAGMVLQKDVGERQYNDYWNAMLAVNFKKGRLTFGSFYLQLAQGLLFSSPFGRMKSSMAMLPFQANKIVVRTYLGSAENFAQTGVCFTGQPFHGTELALFWSLNLRDARYNPQTKKITGFDFSGYHRTVLEEARKDLIMEKIAGFSFKRTIGKNGGLTLSVAGFDFNPPIEFNAQNVTFNELRKDFYHFSGNQILLGSMAYDFRIAALRLAGELAAGKNGGTGITQSVWLEDETFRSGVMFWNLTPNFQSPYGRVFDWNSPFPQAVRGIYFALAWQNNHLRIDFYKLLVQNLWRTYRQQFPPLKDEWLLNLNYAFRSGQLELRWRERSSDATPEASTIARQSVRGLRLQLKIPIEKRLESTTRLELAWLNHPAEKGALSFQELRWNFRRRLSLVGRVTFFRTPSYGTRIYEYESDVPGSFANFPLYGEGFKWYVRMGGRPFQRLGVWFKFRYLRLNDPVLTDIDYGRQQSKTDRLFRLQLMLNL
ncbi:hypothetical protein ACX8XN_08655 [Calditrichota bacterium GD2]